MTGREVSEEIIQKNKDPPLLHLADTHTRY